MPATSEKQRRLMAAALHGADFPMARKVRASMTSEQLRDFSHRARPKARASMTHLRRATQA